MISRKKCLSFCRMNAKLDQLLVNSMKSDDAEMYKSVKPKLKLKILSEHWESKANSNKPPSEIEDSSTDAISFVSVSRPSSSNSMISRNILQNPNQYRIKAQSERNSSGSPGFITVPTKKPPNNLRYSRPDGSSG